MMLTGDGSVLMIGLLTVLQNAFEDRLEMCGRIADGLKKGRFYLSKKRYRERIKETLGFDPYPGTLNIRLEDKDQAKRKRLLQLEPRVIQGFSEAGRTFGDLFAYKARIDGVECAIVVPVQTHHGQETLELVAPANLRKLLGKKTGDSVLLRV